MMNLKDVISRMNRMNDELCSRCCVDGFNDECTTCDWFRPLRIGLKTETIVSQYAPYEIDGHTCVCVDSEEASYLRVNDQFVARVDEETLEAIKLKNVPFHLVQTFLINRGTGASRQDWEEASEYYWNGKDWVEK